MAIVRNLPSSDVDFGAAKVTLDAPEHVHEPVRRSDLVYEHALLGRRQVEVGMLCLAKFDGASEHLFEPT